MNLEIRAFRAALAVLGAVALSAATAAPAAAQYSHRDNSLRFRGGLFEPDGNSTYWTDAEDLFTGDASDLEDAVIGIDYQMDLTGDGRLSLLISGSAYEGEDDREDAFFVDQLGNPIVHTVTLDIASFTAGLKVNLIPHGPVQPYVGAGGGYYVWQLEERGDFVFNDGIFTETFKDDGATLGYYFMAGLDIPFNESFGVFAEGRWHNADDELSDDFEDFGDLDLSGREFSAGFAWTF